MAYKRREVYDNITVMNKDLYDNLQDGIDELLKKYEDVSTFVETHQVETYTSLEQIGLEEGTETIQDIAMALPEYSKLQMKVTSNHNTDIYPGDSVEGILVAKKADNCCKLEYVDANSPTKWLCVGDIVSDGSNGDKCVLTNWEKIAVDSEHNLKTYSTLEQLGLTVGVETIKSIADSMPNGSELEVKITKDNNEIYPRTDGILTVKRGDSDTIEFEFTWITSGSSPTKWLGTYYSTTEEWSGWSKYYNDHNPPTIIAEDGSKFSWGIDTTGLYVKKVASDNYTKEDGGFKAMDSVIEVDESLLDAALYLGLEDGSTVPIENSVDSEDQLYKNGYYAEQTD